jgi:hypothetical protein
MAYIVVAFWLLIDLQVRIWTCKTMVSVIEGIIITMQPEREELVKYVPRHHQSKIKPIICNIMERATKAQSDTVTNHTSGWQMRRNRHTPHRSKIKRIICNIMGKATKTRSHTVTNQIRGLQMRRPRRTQGTKEMKHPPRPARLRQVKWVPRAIMLCLLLTATEAAQGSEGAMDMPHAYMQTCSECDTTMSATAMAAGTGTKRPRLFDTDTFPIKVDNCASRTTSPFEKDFVAGTLKRIRGCSVEGYTVQTMMVTREGTVQWMFENNKGKVREVKITNSYLVPNSKVRLLSPQHWAQQVKDHYPTRQGTWNATDNNEIEIQWDQRKNTKEMPVDPNKTDVVTLRTATGCSKFQAFAAG